MIGKFLRVLLFGLAFLIVMVNVHEVGHTVFARLLGDDSAHYVLYEAQGRSTCLGCNLYDSSRLGDVANVLVNFGGVVFTQLLSWIAIVAVSDLKAALVLATIGYSALLLLATRWALKRGRGVGRAQL